MEDRPLGVVALDIADDQVQTVRAISNPEKLAHLGTSPGRSPAKTDMLRAVGARPIVADALDPDAVAHAVAETDPEA